VKDSPSSLKLGERFAKFNFSWRNFYQVRQSIPEATSNDGRANQAGLCTRELVKLPISVARTDR
jgi:hypothetical protein